MADLNDLYKNATSIADKLEQEGIKNAERNAVRSGLINNFLKQSGLKTAGVTGAISVPLAAMRHNKAIQYYDSIINDPNTTKEQKQLAYGMKFKERMQSLAEGAGTAVGSSIGSMFGGNAGYWAGAAVPNALSAGIGTAFNKGLSPAFDKYNFTPYKGVAKQIQQVQDVNPYQQQTIASTVNNNKQQTPMQSAGATAIDDITRYILDNQTTNDYQGTQLENNLPQTTVSQQSAVTGGTSIQDLIDLYRQQLEDKNKPYIDSLENYNRNYNDLIRRSRNTEEFYNALAGLSGEDGYRNLGKTYNPAIIEAQKIDLIKKLQEAKTSNNSDINTLIGNATIAQQLGLPVEAAMADKNILNTYAALSKANLGLEGRKYNTDARIAMNRLDNQIKLAVASGNWAEAEKLARIRGQVSNANTILSGASYGADASALADILQALGNPSGLNIGSLQNIGPANSMGSVSGKTLSEADLVKMSQR